MLKKYILIFIFCDYYNKEKVNNTNSDVSIEYASYELLFIFKLYTNDL